MTENTTIYNFSQIFLGFLPQIFTLGCIIVALALLGLFIIKSIKKTLNPIFRINLLRFGFWAGALIDLFAFFNMIASIFTNVYSGYEVHGTSIEYMFAIGWGASLMLGWTSLLIWADRKPIERRITILFTAVPVIIGIILTSILTNIACMNQLIGIFLFLFCYFQSLYVK